jgi:hypothetical protein
MPEPKKQSSPRKTGLRRSHLRLELAKRVNKRSPVKVFETAKKTPNLKVCPPTCSCKDCKKTDQKTAKKAKK